MKPPSTGEGSWEEVVSDGERRKGSIQVRHAELGMMAEHLSEEGPMAVGVTECCI